MVFFIRNRCTKIRAKIISYLFRYFFSVVLMQQFTFTMRRGYLVKDLAVFALLRRFFVRSLQFFDFESYLRIAVSAENCAVFRIEFFHRFFSFVELSVESIMCDVEVFETQVPLPPPCAHNLPQLNHFCLIGKTQFVSFWLLWRFLGVASDLCKK